jgi:transcriptional regulator with XRE-family HTH domain
MTVKDSELTGPGSPRRRSDTEAAVAAAVAQQVKALRQARGWSLDELAHRSGVSKGMVVQIEGGRTNPSIGTLVRLAESFGVNVGRLLETDARSAVRLISEAETRTLWHGELGGTARLFVGVNDPAFVEFWEWRFPPGEEHRSADHSPGTRELVHVRTGELVVRVGDAEYRVAAGQTIDLRSDRPHGYRNVGQETAEVIMIVVMPPGEWDRRRPP